MELATYVSRMKFVVTRTVGKYVMLMLQYLIHKLSDFLQSNMLIIIAFINKEELSKLRLMQNNSLLLLIRSTL
jgi:hypothetical protein